MLAEETVLWGPTASLQSLRGVVGIELTFLQLASPCASIAVESRLT